MSNNKKDKETQQQPLKGSHNWLANFLLHHGKQIMPRLAYFYSQLQALPRQTQRKLQKKLALPLAGVALMLALSNTSSVYAANIVVTPGATGFNTGDGCSLVEAIDNANNDAATHPECMAGTGADVITLAGNTYSYNYAGGPGVALPTITSNLTIEGNGATIQKLPNISSFRILEVDSGNLTLNQTTISGGSYENGGGIYSRNSTLTLNNSTVSGNSASGHPVPYYTDGGGMLVENSTVTLNNSIVSGNSADDDAGGIFTRQSYLTLNNSIISENIAGGNGGGISNFYSLLTVNDSTISGNRAQIGGGMAATGITILNNSTISGNTAYGTEGGGGILQMTLTYTNNTQSTLTLNNSTVSGNSARRGGGISNATAGNNNSIMTLNNTTVTDNYARAAGSGILNVSNPNVSGIPISYLNNSIIAQNRGRAGAGVTDCYYNNSNLIYSQGYNIIGINDTCISSPLPSDQVGTTASPLNAMLEPLDDNGGPTLTHALITGSPAIDKIPNGTSTDGIDQRGAARDFDNDTGDSNTTALGDIGAFEMRETITVGACSGADLSGPQTFAFNASPSVITIDVNDANGLKCITVEEMGPGVNHLRATGPGTGNNSLMTNNWWHINGNIDSGFDVDITLPYGSAAADSRVCKWPGNLGGYGWDCGPGDGTGTSYVPNASITRSGLNSFSDWAVGDGVGPTAISLQEVSAKSDGLFTTILGALPLALASLWLGIRRRKQLD
jgi:hypothetical protein